MSSMLCRAKMPKPKCALPMKHPRDCESFDQVYLRGARKDIEILHAQLEGARAALRTQQANCRHWIDSIAGWCNKSAEFILWGKLANPEDLGPRCEKHLAKEISRMRIDQYAVVDLRPVNKVLELSEKRDEK